MQESASSPAPSSHYHNTDSALLISLRISLSGDLLYFSTLSFNPPLVSFHSSHSSVIQPICHTSQLLHWSFSLLFTSNRSSCIIYISVEEKKKFTTLAFTQLLASDKSNVE